MSRTLILLAGYPATGKTFLCNKILERHPEFQTVSQDELKEQKWDEYGFNNMEEKTALEMQAWEEYYQSLEHHMQKKNGIISDYPFSQKQKGRLQDLSEKYKYQVITVRLVGDIDALFLRSQSRDLDPSRHLAHLVSCYHKGDVLEDRSQADCLVNHEIFWERCTKRGYDTFELGHLITADVSDFSKVDYNQILTDIDEHCKE